MKGSHPHPHNTLPHSPLSPTHHTHTHTHTHLTHTPPSHTHLFPPNLTLNTSLESGACSPMSQLVTNVVLVGEAELRYSLPGGSPVDAGGSNT